MASFRVSCPHCGEGTVEISLPPPKSAGVNNAAQEAVTGESPGFDEGGEAMPSGDFTYEDSLGPDAQLVCRSCGRAFSVPENLLIGPLASEGVKRELEVSASMPAPGQPRSEATEGAAEAIAKSLVAILQATRRDLEGVSARHFATLEDTRALVSGVLQDIRSLRTELTTLRGEVIDQAQRAAALANQVKELNEQMAQQEAAAIDRGAAMASALEAEKETSGQLATLVAELQGGLNGFRERMDTQAEVIRALYAAAQEQEARREELKAAAQRLEQAAGGPPELKPLPDQL